MRDYHTKDWTNPRETRFTGENTIGTGQTAYSAGENRLSSSAHFVKVQLKYFSSKSYLIVVLD